MTRASCIFGLRGFCVMLAIAIPVFALAAETGKAPAKRVFRAGAATSNITPWLGDGIVGGWGVPEAKHIHDELHARCLVLDDGTTRLALVIADSVGIPREVFDEAKRQVHEATGLPLDRMLMAADHTHSATSSRPKNVLAPDREFTDYQRFLAHRISDGVRRAINNLEPARIGWGTAEDPRHVFNRRWVMKPGANVPNPFGGQDRVKMNPGHLNPDLLKPSAPVDPQICFLSVQAADGRPMALLANYSLHYVGGVGPQHISGDYFAVFADRIQELLGADRLDPPFVGFMSNGTSGDVNNINYAAPSGRRKPYEKMRYVADELAKKVMEQLKTTTYHDWVPLGMRQRELELAVRKPTPEMVARAKDMIAHPERPDKLPHERTYAHRILQLEEAPPTLQVVLQSVRIGELGIAAIPFEVFADTGLELKAKSPFKPSFTVSLANGTYGYLPTPEQHKLGGYETWFGSNRVEEQASTKITQTLLEMFEELK